MLTKILAYTFTVIKIFLLIYFLGFFNSTAFSEDFFVKGILANVKEEPSNSSKTIFKLKRGTKLFLIEKNNLWTRINYENRQGWLLNDQISNKSIIKIKIKTLSQKLKVNSRKNPRLRIRTVSAITGVKGLVDSEGKLVNPYDTNYASLEYLESKSYDEMESFIFLSKQDND